MSTQVLHGWGRTTATAATVVAGTDAALVTAPRAGRGALPRGVARSYGDAALNAGGTVLDMTARNRIWGVDTAVGTARVDAGVTLAELLRAIVPHGWFVPVTPGTRMVTVGGAIAVDIHGKNHVADGSIRRHVRGFTLATPDGGRRWVTPDDHEVFAATLGGMGLTGPILDAELDLRPITTTAMRATTTGTRDLDDTMACLDRSDATYRIATVDLSARGARLGRGIVDVAEHALPDDLPGDADPLAYDPPQLPAVPDVVPGGLLNRWSAKVGNAAWVLRVPRRPRRHVVPMTSYFYPLDAIPEWNRMYGPRGFVQYQFVVPRDQPEAVRRVAGMFTAAGCPTFVAVLKRLGPGGGMLSFPIEGWTLAVDIPAGVAGLARLLDACDDEVSEAGGRVYLAKDGRLRAARMPAMYPELDRWRAVRDALDPQGRWRSDLGRRLGLCPT